MKKFPTDRARSRSSASSSSSSRDTWFGDRNRQKRVSVFDIPSAIPKRRMQQVDLMFEEQKRYLAHRLPVYTAEEIARLRHPPHIVFLHQLSETGYDQVACELKEILAKDAKALGEAEDYYKPLAETTDKFEYLGDQLMASLEFERRGRLELAIEVRKRLAEEIIGPKSKQKYWLATHLLTTCLELTEKLKDLDMRAQIKGEINCMLGYLELERKPDPKTFITAMTYLERSRLQCKGKDWLFQSRVLALDMKKPVFLYGLREDYEVVDGRSMTIYSISNLLMYQALSLKASGVVFSPVPTEAELKAAQSCAQDALRFAEESGQWIAMSAAYMMLGAVYLKRGDFEEALDHFGHFTRRAALRRDFETEAIGFNMIGCCYIGLQDPSRALENFVCQKEVADANGILDLAIDALQNIGQVLLAEGQMLEAEACCFLVNQNLKELRRPVLNQEKLVNNSWIRFAVSAGMNAWARLAGHCRLGDLENLSNVNKWKGYRRALPVLKQDNFSVQDLYDVFEEAERDNMQVVPATASEISRFFKTNKKLLDGISNNGVPFGEDPVSSSHKIASAEEIKDARKTMMRVKYAAIRRRRFSALSESVIDITDSDLSTGPYDSDRRRPISKSKKAFQVAVASARLLRHRATAAVVVAEKSHDHEDMPRATQSDVSVYGVESDMSESESRTKLTPSTMRLRNKNTHGGISLAANVAKARDSIWAKSAMQSMAMLHNPGFATKEKLSVVDII